MLVLHPKRIEKEFFGKWVKNLESYIQRRRIQQQKGLKRSRNEKIIEVSEWLLNTFESVKSVRLIADPEQTEFKLVKH